MDLPPNALRPLASVVVPVHNGAGTLNGCLDALAAQAIAADLYEVIVVDDGSNDGSASVATRHGVRVLRQPHAGVAAARNRGAQEARAKILLFTDADCEPLPDWIQEMLAPFSDSTVMGVKGAYLTRQHSLVASFTQAEYEEKYEHLARAENIDFVDTHSAAYRREDFLEAGGFDSSFVVDEDQEFSYRLARAGSRLVFAPEARVWHQHPASVWQYTWRKVVIGRWKVKVHILHPSKVVYDSYTPRTQKVQLALVPLVLGTGIAAALGYLPWIYLLGTLVIGLLASIPLVRKAIGHGRAVAVLAPCLVLVRTLALTAGIIWGVASEVLNLFSRQESAQR